MQRLLDHCCGEHLLKYLPLASVLAFSRTCSTMRKFVESREEVWEKEIPNGMASELSPRDAIQSIGRASNMLLGRMVPNCDIATDKVVHVLEFDCRFFVVTHSLCVFVSDDRSCSQFYWYAHGTTAYGTINDVSSCGSDLFAASIHGMRWLSLDATRNARQRQWSQLVLPFPITRISIEVPGYAYLLLNTGTIGFYKYRNMGSDREQTYFVIRPVYTMATHLVAMPDSNSVVVGCTRKFIATLGMREHTEKLTMYSDAGPEDSIEAMQLIRPSHEVAVLFKNFHLCIMNPEASVIRRVGLVPFSQTLPVCMATHGNNIHIFPYCQQFTYSDKKKEVRITNPLHGRIVTSCLISQDCTMAVLSCLVGEIFAVNLVC